MRRGGSALRRRAASEPGTVLIARGEFSIVIAALGSSLVNGPELGALAAGYVLITAIVGPIGRKVRRPDPAADPADARVGSSSGLNALAGSFGRWTDQISSPFAARTVRSS